jgi:glycosyltransferase involved in cell wall biosynthesis
MKKRIALVGNMNNNFFAILRYLRDEGYDAQLFYKIAEEHFQPKADTFDLNFMEYCHDVKWSNEYSNENRIIILQDLKNFDFYIGQGDEAALAHFAGVNFNVYYPYGSDFHKYAWLPQEFTFLQKVYAHFVKKIPISVLNNGTPAKYIRSTIVNANHVYLDYTNEKLESKLFKLNLKGIHKNIPMPFIYYKQYENEFADVHWKSQIDLIRKENDFILLYHGRQEWKKALEYKNNDFTFKNTHHLIEGFALFCKAFPENRAKLIMLEYGGDVLNSKKLISELQIADKVIWFPKMYRKDIMYLIKNVDVCSGEFNDSYLTFGTIIEAMIMGKPVVHYREDELYKEYPELYPLYNAREANDIFLSLKDAFLNEEKRQKIGLEAKNWVKKYFIENPLEELIKVIEN